MKHLVTMSMLLLVLLQTAVAQTMVAPLDPVALDQLHEGADQVTAQHNQVLLQVTVKTENYLQSNVEAGAVVAEALNTWVKDPTPVHRAALMEKIIWAATQLREAAKALGQLDDEIGVVVPKLRAGIHGGRQELSGVQTRIEVGAAAFRDEFDRLEGLRKKMREELLRKGFRDESELPPREREELFNLAVDHNESLLQGDLWQDVAQMLAQYDSVLARADEDYADIERMARMIARQAESTERVSASVVAARGLQVRMELVSRAYGQSGAIRLKIAEGFNRMQETQATLRSIVTAGMHVPARTEGAPRLPERSGVWAWLLQESPSE